MQDVMGKYNNLIKYLKLDFLRGTLYLSDSTNEYDRLKKYVEKIFEIDTTETQLKRFSWIKRYIISEDSKRWDILVGTASLLFAHNMQKMREQLLKEENIHGVITLKNAFFEVSALPTAVIVFGSNSAQEIWLTSAASSEDIITI